MFKAIKNNKIVAISDVCEIFPCLVLDEVIEDKEHTSTDYVDIEGEYVLSTDKRALDYLKQKRIERIYQLLDEVDMKSIRAIRANEQDNIARYENEAQQLREELKRLQEEDKQFDPWHVRPFVV